MRDMMFSSKTDNELLRFHNGMLGVAREMKLPIKAPTVFEVRADLIKSCEELHALIEKSRPQPSGSPGLRRLRNDPRAEKLRQQALSDYQAAHSAAAKERLDMFNSDEGATAPETTDAPAPAARKPRKPKGAAKAKPAKVAKAKPAKVAKAKGAKKAAAKPAKAAKAKKDNMGGTRAVKINGGCRLKMLVTENPRRKGTVQWERFEKLMKFNGKLAEEYIHKGGDRACLNNAIERKEFSAK